jgi:hypothetical protein
LTATNIWIKLSSLACSCAANRDDSPVTKCEEKQVMRTRIQNSCLVAAAVLLCFVPRLLGQELQIDNPPSNNVLDGIYVGSYSASDLTTGGSLQIVCDDFKDNSDFNASSYTTNTFSSLGSTLWGSYLLGNGGTLTQVTTLYDESAWLTLGMLKQTGTEQGYYSYAIWAIFDASDVAAWLTRYGDSSACNAVFGAGSWSGGKCTAGTGGLVGSAASQTFTSGEFSNLLILTPNGCTSGPGSCPEQEFFEVVAEGGTAALYLLLAGSACFGAILLRSRQQSHARRVA